VIVAKKASFRDIGL